MLVSPRRILWPTDFSSLSLQGGLYAQGFRDVFGAELHVIHVIPPPLNPDISVMLPGEVPVSVTEPELVEACAKGLDRFVAEQFSDDESIVREVFLGNPWSGVCEYAKRAEIDLIIVSTHGRTGLRHALIGSTAERIVRHAYCPVLVVKGDEREFLVE